MYIWLKGKPGAIRGRKVMGPFGTARPQGYIHNLTALLQGRFFVGNFMPDKLHNQILAICDNLNKAGKKEIKTIMADACLLLGWEYYAFVTHIVASFKKTKVLASTNYPLTWLAIYKLKNYYNTDPVVAHCMHNNLPITWSSKKDYWKDFDPKTITFMQDCRKNGWTCGVGVPIHSHHNHGIMHFTTKKPQEEMGLPIELARLYGSIVGVHLFEALARINLSDTIKLSNREQEVLQFVADGYSSKMIAKTLGISEVTVTFHITNAQKKIGAKTRQELVTKAYSRGLLHINLHWGDHVVMNWPEIDQKLEDLQSTSNKNHLN